MGIYIHGLSLPPKGEAYLVDPDGVVYRYIPTDDGEDHIVRKIDAKPVELPPHGRLIDADALIADIKRQCREVFRVDAVSPDDFWITRNEAYNERLWGTWCESFFGYLRTRPTIIPAEGGVDG